MVIKTVGDAESFWVGIVYVFHVLAYFLLISLSLFLLYRVNVISISMFPESCLCPAMLSVLEKVLWAA